MKRSRRTLLEEMWEIWDQREVFGEPVSLPHGEGLIDLTQSGPEGQRNPRAVIRALRRAA